MVVLVTLLPYALPLPLQILKLLQLLFLDKEPSLVKLFVDDNSIQTASVDIVHAVESFDHSANVFREKSLVGLAQVDG